MHNDLPRTLIPDLCERRTLLRDFGETRCRQRRNICVCRRLARDNAWRFRTVSSHNKCDVGLIDCSQRR